MENECNVCSKKAVVSLPYGPHKFCRKHFLFFFEKRVRRTIRMNHLVKPREKVLVGLSGGKDSTAALYLLNKIFSKTNEIIALMIDEGIKGYRDKALKIAGKNCKQWKVPFKKVSFKKEFGITMTEIMRKTTAKKVLGSTCSFCGVMRRNLLNKYALELNADKLVTGHNLDDEVQSIVMNFFENDLNRFKRLGAIVGNNETEEFVPRVKPLCETPEKDVITYVSFLKLKTFSEECCPFRWQAKRNDFRKMLDDFELKYPGTKYSILNFFKEVKPKLVGKEKVKVKIKKCEKCGSPTSGKICSVCKKLELLKKK